MSYRNEADWLHEWERENDDTTPFNTFIRYFMVAVFAVDLVLGLAAAYLLVADIHQQVLHR